MNYKFVLFIAAMLLCKCGKDNIVPNIRFDVTINLSDPKYANKDVINLVDVEDYFSKITMRIGYSGVIVYKSDNYRAFEKYCPNDQKDDCKISIKENETTKAVCNCCKTEYLLLTGTVVSGESKYGLKEYKTDYLYERNLLRIWN